MTYYGLKIMIMRLSLAVFKGAFILNVRVRLAVT